MGKYVLSQPRSTGDGHKELVPACPIALQSWMCQSRTYPDHWCMEPEGSLLLGTLQKWATTGLILPRQSRWCSGDTDGAELLHLVRHHPEQDLKEGAASPGPCQDEVSSSLG